VLLLAAEKTRISRSCFSSAGRRIEANRAPSEPRDIRERHLPAADVHPAELRATMQRREDLAGIEELLRVEGTLQPLLLLEVVLGEHGGHQVSLLDPDAVLAGEHAADFGAEAQDVAAELLGL